MSYFTRDFATLKAAVQGALPYSVDLTAATLQTVTDMGAEYTSLADPDWYQSFFNLFAFYCLETFPAPMWSVKMAAGDIYVLKRDQQIARFLLLSDTQWRVILPDLGFADWTKQP